MSKLPAKRTASIALAATAAAAALSLAFVTSASATADADAPQAAAAAPTVSGSPEGAFTRIADFYGAYIDAVYDNDGTRADQLRAAYLSAPLRREHDPGLRPGRSEDPENRLHQGLAPAAGPAHTGGGPPPAAPHP